MPHTRSDHTADGPIATAVAALLRHIPDRWTAYDYDALTATEEQALFLLVAAGLVERRIRFRKRVQNHPVAVEATITATGEEGFREAMQSLNASMWPEWGDAYKAWMSSDARDAPFSATERLKPDEWRLTDQGVLARDDSDGSRTHVVVDFVLRRGFFDDQPRLIPGTGKIMRREPVPGAGQLVKLRKVRVELTGPATVHVGNWQEGAEAFGAVFGTPRDATPGAHGRSRPSAANNSTQASTATADDSFLSPRKLAEIFGVPADALRSRLNRWRRRNHTGWIEVEERGSREPRYLYRVGAIRHIIDALRETSEATSKRPAKKK